MSLANLVRGKIERPYRVILAGVEGIGKSTFGSEAPSPIFIAPEEGTSHLDVARFPQPETWTDVTSAIGELTTAEHDFKTLVVDTLDWLEPVLWKHICDRDNQPSVESYGYGKGYNTALDEWRVFLASLERLQAARRMHVILIAHTWIKSFKNPDGDDFDRYEMKLHNRAAALIREWADCALFTNYETLTARDEKTKRVKGISTGERLIYTTRTAAWDAKNRYGLPDRLPLSWSDFADAVKRGQPADPAALIEAIRENVERLDDDTKQKALAALEKAGANATKLAELHNRVLARVAEQGA